MGSFQMPFHHMLTPYTHTHTGGQLGVWEKHGTEL